MERQRWNDKQFYGIGVEWAEALQEEIAGQLDRVSLVELIPENFFTRDHGGFLKRLRDADMPVLIHSVELSIGTDEPLKQKHFEKILRVADQVRTANVSDHLCMTEAGGVEIGQLTPLPWTEKARDVVCRKIDQVQAQLSVPFLIENITNRFVIPQAQMTETEFINGICRRTGCYFLLDLNNVYTNAVNFHFDPYEWIDAIDLNSVLAVHLAGGMIDDEGDLMDSHNRVVPPPVWDLYRYVCNRLTPACTIVEWTDDTPPYEVLLGDIDKGRTILNQSQAASFPQITAVAAERSAR